MTENKKIRNATVNIVDGISFKSKLEALVYKTLKDNKFDVHYEPHKYIIWAGYRPKVMFYDKNPKTGLLKWNVSKLKDITYTPDFEFDYDGLKVIIEVKGIYNDVFPVKKKLFRKFLESLDTPVIYFELYSKKQLLQAIEIVKSYKKMNKIAQIKQMLESLPKKDKKLGLALLEKRDFPRLKELVDSDVIILANKLFKDVKSEEDLKKNEQLEEQYEILKELQIEVDAQAEAFISEGEENYVYD